MKHQTSDIQSKRIGNNTNIWQYVVILPGAIIGNGCNICAHCFIENDVIIGNNVTIKNGVYLWDGIRIGNNVFIGPNATFTNDKFPRSKQYPSEFQKTIIEDWVSIGAGAVILGSTTIGKGAMIGAGSIVTKDVPPGELWVGNPAKFVKKIQPGIDN
jgi:UDP-2-acetamido-3-amino-2,3-dideoxy-glucuronate N-acetyltransferase